MNYYSKVKLNLISIIIFIALPVIAFSNENLFDKNKEIKKIKKIFDNYKKMLINNNGLKAIDYLDSISVNYYSKLNNLVVYADSTELSQLNITDKILVLLIKHRTPKDTLLSFNGKKLLIYAINNGMVGKESLTKTSLGDSIILTNNTANINMIHDGIDYGYKLVFHKENDLWKFNITSLLKVSESIFKILIELNNTTEIDFINEFLKNSNDEKPKNDIWHPLIRNK